MRKRIHVVWQRCVVLGVALPVAVVGSIAAVALPCAAIDLIREHRNTASNVYILLGGAFILGTVYVFGRITRAIVASTTKE